MVKLAARLESAQHILHHILVHEYHAVQTGMQIHENKIRLDVSCKEDLRRIEKKEIEDRVNEVIKRRLLVTKKYYPREEVPKDIVISNVPKEAKKIRIVSIGDFDTQACGNPHVNNTAEIGRYILKDIKGKGKDIYRFIGEVVNEEERKKTRQSFSLQTARGVRDFPPEEKIIRDEIISTIKQAFELYGFNPIETPVLERYDVLAAKFAAGEASETMKETFSLTDNGGRRLGLRYDMTVPFSRYVGMNPHIKMPFKKYLMGDVFRDGPIKTGRYREFMQMDPDIVGTDSMLADAEIIALAEAVFTELGFSIEIELNNRKIIDGLVSQINIPKDKHFDVIISIDKLKKIGEKGVSQELEGKNLSKKQVKEVLALFRKADDNRKTIALLKKSLTHKVGVQGLQEIEELLKYLELFEVSSVTFEPSLARGLAYYTGPIYEVFLKDSRITSAAAGGGRYDELISNYLGSKKQYPATGISFGIEVIIEAVKERQKLRKKSIVQVFVIPIKTTNECIRIVSKLRKAGINTDFDIIGRGVSANLQYADAYGIPFVLFVGEHELKQHKVKLRDMGSGEEWMLRVEEVADRVKHVQNP